MGWTALLDGLVPNPAAMAGRTLQRGLVAATVLAVMLGGIVTVAAGGAVALAAGGWAPGVVLAVLVWVGTAVCTPPLFWSTERMLGARGPVITRWVVGLSLTVGTASAGWAGASAAAAPYGGSVADGALCATFGVCGLSALSMVALVPLVWATQLGDRPVLDRWMGRAVHGVGALVLALAALGVVRWVRVRPPGFGAVGTVHPALPWQWMILALAGVAVAAVTVAVRDRRLALWSTPDTWRAARVDGDRWIHFADGAAQRQASVVFQGWQGEVVVVPTAERVAGPFRGDGAPSDGWVIPGTVARLRKAVQVSRAAANAMALGVLCAGAAPLIACVALGLLRPW